MASQHALQLCDCYRLLGISRDASDVDIRRAFRSQARIWHPDKCMASNASEQFRLIRQAFETLTSLHCHTTHAAAPPAATPVNQSSNKVGRMNEHNFTNAPPPTPTSEPNKGRKRSSQPNSSAGKPETKAFIVPRARKQSSTSMNVSSPVSANQHMHEMHTTPMTVEANKKAVFHVSELKQAMEKKPLSFASPQNSPKACSVRDTPSPGIATQQFRRLRHSCPGPSATKPVSETANEVETRAPGDSAMATNMFDEMIGRKCRRHSCPAPFATNPILEPATAVETRASGDTAMATNMFDEMIVRRCRASACGQEFLASKDTDHVNRLFHERLTSNSPEGALLKRRRLLLGAQAQALGATQPCNKSRKSDSDVRSSPQSNGSSSSSSSSSSSDSSDSASSSFHPSVRSRRSAHGRDITMQKPFLRSAAKRFAANVLRT